MLDIVRKLKKDREKEDEKRERMKKGKRDIT